VVQLVQLSPLVQMVLVVQLLLYHLSGLVVRLAQCHPKDHLALLVLYLLLVQQVLELQLNLEVLGLQDLQ